MITDTIYEHFRDVYQTKVESLVSECLTFNPEDSVSEVVNKLTKNDSYGAFYREGNSVFTIDLRSILSVRHISKMRIREFMYTIPSLKVSDTIQEACNIISHHRIREAPVLRNNKLEGVVNAKELLKMMSKKDNRWIKANLVYTHNPITVSSTDTIGTARKLMVSKKIDHLPVIKKDKVRQVITSYHIIQAIPRKEKIGRMERGKSKIHSLESQIGNIGSTRVPQCGPNDSLNKILEQMLKTDTTCCLINVWGNLEGIITYRDLLSLLAVKMESEIPLYIVGLPEDQSHSVLIASKLKNTLTKVQKVYQDILEARVSIKQHRSGRKKEGTYEISALIVTSRKNFVFSTVGFDLSTVMEELSQKLLRKLARRNKRRSKGTIRKMGLPTSPM